MQSPYMLKRRSRPACVAIPSTANRQDSHGLRAKPLRGSPLLRRGIRQPQPRPISCTENSRGSRRGAQEMPMDALLATSEDAQARATAARAAMGARLAQLPDRNPRTYWKAVAQVGATSTENLVGDDQRHAVS